MTHRFIAFLVIASLTFLAPRPAAAAVTHTFDTVDAVEIAFYASSSQPDRIIVTGILVGQTTPTTVTFNYNTFERVRECKILALIAIAKPGKYQFAIGAGSQGSCKLIRHNP